MKQLRMMPTLARTLAKKLPTALGSRTTRWTALACFWRTVNTLTLSVTLVSVEGESAQLKMKVDTRLVVRYCLHTKVLNASLSTEFYLFSTFVTLHHSSRRLNCSTRDSQAKPGFWS